MVLLPTAIPYPSWLASSFPEALPAEELNGSATLDLRRPTTRLVVLQALASLGQALGVNWTRPWALGGIWVLDHRYLAKGLDDDQAARATAACVLAAEQRRSLPAAVFGPWVRSEPRSLIWTRELLAGHPYLVYANDRDQKSEDDRLVRNGALLSGIHL